MSSSLQMAFWEIVSLLLTHPPLLQKELFQLLLLTHQLQLHVLTARQKPLMVLAEVMRKIKQMVFDRISNKERETFD